MQKGPSTQHFLEFFEERAQDQPETGVIDEGGERWRAVGGFAQGQVVWVV